MASAASAPFSASVFAAVSLDGFLARLDGSLDWLPGADGAEAGEPDAGDGAAAGPADFGFAAFLASVDVLVMGRNTWETVSGFEGPWPYGDLPVVVMSSGSPHIPTHLQDRVRVSGLGPANLAIELAAEGRTTAYVDGGVTVRGFLAAGLVDRIVVTWIPVLLGEGRPLFGHGGPDLALTHRSTTTWPNGFVQSTYSSAPG